MKILVVGGGSGGHVTPLVAVVAELRKKQADSSVAFWCDRPYFDQAVELMGDYDESIPVDAIISGKFRRYSSIPLWRQLLMLREVALPNIIDSFKIGLGFIQSIIKLVQLRPDVVFTKGGFVCLPVGLAARLLAIPLVIHDSDAHPGLTNRILARWATSIATGAPTKLYPYPKQRTHYVGIPLRQSLRPPMPKEQLAFKSDLGFDATKPLVVITGGGLGALRINNATAAVLDSILEASSVMLVSGTKQYSVLASQLAQYTDTSRFQLHSHVSHRFSDSLAAADIVVSRAGATTLLELAALGKPALIIPNARLTGGHQLKNAARYRVADAIVQLDDDTLESRPETLAASIKSLLSDRGRLHELSTNIHALAMPDAARKTADLVIDAVGR